MMTLYQKNKHALKLIAMDLDVGQRDRNITCPWCGVYSSCCLTKTEYGFIFTCYRASCSLGHTLIEGGVDATAGSVRKTKIKEYPDVLVEPPGKILRFLELKFDLLPEQIKYHGILYNPNKDTIVYPIYNSLGFITAYLDRDYFHERKPKALIYPMTEGALYHLPPREERGTKLLLVEDVVSAIKASYHIDTLALLGTSLSDQVASVVGRLYDEVFIALDADTWKMSAPPQIKVRDKILPFVKEVSYLSIDKDIKDMTHERILRLVSEL